MALFVVPLVKTGDKRRNCTHTLKAQPLRTTHRQSHNQTERYLPSYHALQRPAFSPECGGESSVLPRSSPSPRTGPRTTAHIRLEHCCRTHALGSTTSKNVLRLCFLQGAITSGMLLPGIRLSQTLHCHPPTTTPIRTLCTLAPSPHSNHQHPPPSHAPTQRWHTASQCSVQPRHSRPLCGSSRRTRACSPASCLQTTPRTAASCG